MRAIDDGSEFLQNATVIAPEKINLGGFEEYVSLAKEWCRAVSATRQVTLVLPDGEVLRGRLHREWTLSSARDLVGRTADLKNAYKQIAALPAHRKYAVVAVVNPKGETNFFTSNTLLFGESAFMGLIVLPGPSSASALRWGT